jgi:phage-related protein
MYTNYKKTDDPRSGPRDHSLAPVIFQGDSRELLQSFPEGVKSDLGYALYQLQLELREGDARAWYRVLFIRHQRVIQVLHCFERRSNAIEQKDIETAKARLKRVLEAEREEKRHAKQTLRKR